MKNRLADNIKFEQGYAMRGLAMLLIILTHSLNEYEVYTSALSHFLLIPMLGTLACSLFFFMSGYGLFHSLNKEGALLNGKYLYNHLIKLLAPFAVIYLASFVILPHTMAESQATPDYTNIFTLSLPDGTDVWFLKVTLFNYITTFLLCKAQTTDKRKIIYITAVQALLIAILYINKCAGYCYISNMSFAIGALYTTQKEYNSKTVIAATLVFVIYYIGMNCGISTAPLQIAGNIAICIIAATLLKKVKRAPSWLQYIGRHSLSYYLMAIPVMWLVPSDNLHYLCYFLANLLLTTVAVALYNLLDKHILRHLLI